MAMDNLKFVKRCILKNLIRFLKYPVIGSVVVWFLDYFFKTDKGTGIIYQFLNFSFQAWQVALDKAPALTIIAVVILVLLIFKGFKDLLIEIIEKFKK